MRKTRGLPGWASLFLQTCQTEFPFAKRPGAIGKVLFDLLMIDYLVDQHLEVLLLANISLQYAMHGIAAQRRRPLQNFKLL